VSTPFSAQAHLAYKYSVLLGGFGILPENGFFYENVFSNKHFRFG
jgi:hypothetical protein